MKIPGLRHADEKIGGLAHFGRMLEKIRLAAAGQLPDGYYLGRITKGPGELISRKQGNFLPRLEPGFP